MSYQFVDSYGDLDNHPDNIAQMAKEMVEHGSVLVSWVDHRSTRLDVILSQPHRTKGSLQSGYPKTTVFVSVLGFGAYGFARGFDFDYLCERLKMRPSPTTEALFVLVEGLLTELES